MTVTQKNEALCLPKIKTKKMIGTPMVLRDDQEYIVTLSRVTESGLVTLALKNVDEMKHHPHLTDLKNSNSAMKLNATDFRVGLVVIVWDAKSDSYFRGQILTKPDKDKKVLVLSLDTGHVVRRDSDSFFYISKEYLLEPFGSFKCHLEGLTFFESTELFRKVLVGNKDCFAGDLVATLDNYGKDGLPRIWLKSGHGNLDLNGQLLQELYIRGPGLFPTKNETIQKRASISHYDTSPDVFLHLAEDSFVVDMEAIISETSLETLLTKGSPLEIEELTLTDIYLAPFEDALYRAKCVKTTPVEGSDADPLIEVEFIDYGNKSEVLLSQLRKAELIDSHLEYIPALCHKVHLKWVQSIAKPEEFSEVIDGETFIIDIRQPLADGSPVIALHRINPDGTTGENLNKELVKKHICKGYSMKSSANKAKSSVTS